MRPSSLAPLLIASLTLGTAASAVAQHQHSDDYAAAMRVAHAGEVPTPTPAALAQPAAPVTDEEVVYGIVDGKPVRGFLSRPAAGGKHLPSIVVVHEWWGLNDNIKSMARRLAGEGYVALAVDLFGGNVATSPDSAAKLYRYAMEHVPAGEANLAAAINYLKKTGASTIGSIGWCFGGHWSLRAAIVGGDDIKADVVYYGPPITGPAALGRIRAPVLGFYGGMDKSIPVDSVRAMERELRRLGKSVEILIYDDASHAFANPSGQSYNAKDAEDAWTRTIAFYKQHLK
jgi:carboxymethylenebutenolidase